MDEAAELFTGSVQKAGLAKMFFESKPSKDGIDSVKISFNLVKSIELLGSNLSIDDFKAQWAKNVLDVRYGLNLDEENAKYAIDILNELKSGKSEIWDELNPKANQNTQDPQEDAKQNEQKDKPFKPIQGYSKN